MKKILFLILLLIPLSFVYADGISTSTSTITLKEGSSSSFVINASSCAGRVDIISSNPSVVSVSSNKEFLDNNQVSIKVNAIKEGLATITIKLTDIVTYSEKTISGTRSISVNVLKNEENTSINPIVSEKSSLNITKFEVVGYNLDFDINKYEYTIDVDSNTEEIFINVEGDNFTSTNTGEINIKNKNQIIVNLKNDSESKNYIINLNKNINQEKSKEENKRINILFFIIPVLIIIILIILIIISSKKNKNIENQINYNQNTLG